jgi:hypothetical protein
MRGGRLLAIRFCRGRDSTGLALKCIYPLTRNKGDYIPDEENRDSSLEFVAGQVEIRDYPRQLGTRNGIPIKIIYP